jgi:mRNA-degrading endonuclease RelE of RelBE toxin-antitoxin system
VKYRIEYSRDALEHLRLLTTREQRLVLDRSDRMLAHDPAVETRSRRPMRPNLLAPGEVRIGSIRVY